MGSPIFSTTTGALVGIHLLGGNQAASECPEDLITCPEEPEDLPINNATLREQVCTHADFN